MIFYTAVDAVDAEQSTRLQRPKRLAGDGQSKRALCGQFGNALGLFADELCKEAETRVIGKHPASTPQRRLQC